VKIWKSLIIIFCSILLALAGYWIYRTQFSARQVNSLEVIGSDAVFVFETYQAADTWNSLVSGSSWSIFKAFPAFSTLSEQLGSLDSLAGESGKISRLVNGNQVTVSFHPTGVETFETLFTLNARPRVVENFLEDLEGRIPNGTSFRTRNYSEIEVIEFFDQSNSRQWSIANLEGLVVLSASSFLVEDAIRHFVNEDPQSFNSFISAESYNSESPGRLLISGKGLASLLKGVSSDRETADIAALDIFQGGLALDLSFEENELQFKGPLFMQDEVNFTPALQANLAAIEATIPNRTLAVTQYNLESIFETQRIINRAFVGRATFSGDIQQKLIDRGFLDDLTGELYLLQLENFGGSSENQALLTRSRSPENSFELLREFQESSSDGSTDFYRGYEILYFQSGEFPAHLFSGKFTGFNQAFVVLVDEVIIFSNSQQAMKMVLDDIDSGNTWATSPRAPAAKKSLSPTSGFAKIFLIDQIWDSWTKITNPSWSSFLQKYTSAFQNFSWVSFRVNQLQDKTEATLSIPFQAGEEAEIQTSDAVTLTPSNRIAFTSRLNYGPKSILNFQDNTEDILVQDEDFVIHLINADGEEVYSYPLTGPIVSEAFQIDYYKNGKLQLIFATADGIYGIDRLGNLLPSYPMQLSGEEINRLNLVDYSNTKDYRFFISTSAGNLYLFDKTGAQLDGWNPLSIGEKTVGPPVHHRVPGKGDFMTALTESGKLLLFNRRGEKQSGSGNKLGESFNSSLALWRNPSSQASLLVGITNNGEVIHSNFNGEISYRNQLIKEDRESEFAVVPDQSNNDFVLVSKQYNQVNVLDRNENLLFSTRVSQANLIYQYFDFGSDRQIFAITDQVQEFCYLYDLGGNLITTMPLESSGPIQVTYQSTQGQYIIRTVSGSTLTEFQLAD